MFLKSIVVENVKSFRKREEINFDNDFNLLIGPNGGGKSNLLDIISISLTQHIVPNYIEATYSNGKRAETVSENNNISGGTLESYLGNEDQDTIVELSLELSDQDIEEFETVVNHVDQLSSVEESRYNSSRVANSNLASADVDYVRQNREVKLEIRNEKLRNPADNKHIPVRSYLKIINYVIMLGDDIESLDVSPVYFHFSAHRGGTEPDNTIELPNENYYQLLSEYMSSTSSEQTSAVKLALYKISEKYLMYKDEHDVDEFYTDDEVSTLTEYFEKIGYDWDLLWEDRANNVFRMALGKGGREYNASQLSSGENEIANMLLGILSINAQGGLILIDEPELHLHPIWQKIMINLISELNSLTKNQFVLTTHSAAFIDQETVSYVRRVYQKDDSSTVTTISEDELNSMDNMIHIINSSNNEKIFFADKIILVEGPTDRIIFQAMVDEIIDRRDDLAAVEVLDVGGKGFFDDYSKFLDLLEIPCYVIADRDYAHDLSKKEGRSDITKFFEPNMEKVDDRMKKLGGGDVIDLAEGLERAVDSGTDESFADVREKWEAVKANKRDFKSSLTSAEQERWCSYVREKWNQGMYMLSQGAIESYTPYSGKSIDKAIQLTEQPSFEQWLERDTGNPPPRELMHIIARIVVD